MTDSEKIAFVKAISEETDDSVITAFLTRAKSAILNELYRAWSELPEDADVPDRYHVAQCELAMRYLNRRGGEGEISHSENGIGRGYGSVDDSDILARITPLVEVPK